MPGRERRPFGHAREWARAELLGRLLTCTAGIENAASSQQQFGRQAEVSVLKNCRSEARGGVGENRRCRLDWGVRGLGMASELAAGCRRSVGMCNLQHHPNPQPPESTIVSPTLPQRTRSYRSCTLPASSSCDAVNS